MRPEKRVTARSNAPQKKWTGLDLADEAAPELVEHAIELRPGPARSAAACVGVVGHVLVVVDERDRALDLHRHRPDRRSTSRDRRACAISSRVERRRPTSARARSCGAAVGHRDAGRWNDEVELDLERGSVAVRNQRGRKASARSRRAGRVPPVVDERGSSPSAPCPPPGSRDATCRGSPATRPPGSTATPTTARRTPPRDAEKSMHASLAPTCPPKP